MTQAQILAIDVATRSFQVCGTDRGGAVLFNRVLSRARLQQLLSDQSPCIVAMETCATSHFWGVGRLIGRTKGGMNTKLHAVTDANGRPINFFITAGQVSDYIGAAALLDELPKAKWLLADRGYDVDWYRALYRRRASLPAFRVGNPATRPSNTTSGATNDATGSRSCSGGSKTGGVSLHATTGAQWPSSPPSLSLQPSSSGYEQ